MGAILIDAKGAYIAACYFGVLPAVLILVVWVLRRFGIKDHSLPKGRPLYLMLAIGLVCYFSLIWTWLFYDQFYRVIPEDEGRWRLEYEMPARTTLIHSADIEKIVSGWGGKGYTRIIIKMKDGTRYRSAQLAQHRLPDTISMLNAWLIENYR